MRLKWFIQLSNGQLFTDYSYNKKNGKVYPRLSSKLDKAKPFNSEEEALAYARLFPQYRTFKVVELVAPLSKEIKRKKQLLYGFREITENYDW